MPRRIFRHVVHFLSHPIEEVAHYLKFVGVVRCNKRARLVVGVMFMALGSSLASAIPHGISFVAHVALDTLAYGIHGLGLAPVIKSIAEATNMEL